MLAQVNHEPGLLVAALAEVLQRGFPILVQCIRIGARLQENEPDAVVVVEYRLPYGSQPGACLQIRVGSMHQKPGDDEFAALPGGYLQRGVAVVQGIGVGPLLQQQGGGGCDALATLLVAAFVLAYQETQRGFVARLHGIGAGAGVQGLAYLSLIYSFYRSQEFLVGILHTAAGIEQQAGQQEYEAAKHAPYASKGETCWQACFLQNLVLKAAGQGSILPPAYEF